MKYRSARIELMILAEFSEGYIEAIVNLLLSASIGTILANEPPSHTL